MAGELTRRSAFVEGFALVLREPALILGELTWRWCFGIAAWLVLVSSTALYLDSLTIGPADQLLLSTLRPALIVRAIEHVFRGSLLRFVWMDAVVLTGLLLLWSLAATLGRAAILGRLCAVFAPNDAPSPALRLAPLFTLNLLRAVWSLAAACALTASLLLGSAFVDQQKPARAAFFLVFGTSLSLIFGGVLNWLLGLAPLFCVLQGSSAPEAFAAAADFWIRRGRSLSGLNLGFFLLRIVWAGTMFLFFWSPMSLARTLAPGWIVLLMGFAVLVYFGGADVLALARTAACVVLATEEESGPTAAQEPGPAAPSVPPPTISPEFEPA